MAMDSAQKQAVIAKFAKHEGDTGSAEVQIALLTARINGILYTSVPEYAVRNQL